MPTATLLLREKNTSSLSTLVEQSIQRPQPTLVYDIALRSCHLELTLRSSHVSKLPSTDEGFESDVDSVSIVSSDDSFTATLPETSSKTPETDSANGSASSDSDTDQAPAPAAPIPQNDTPRPSPARSESHHLVHCMCYTNVKFPNLLIFVIREETLVFEFDNLEALQSFYGNFSTLKAVTSQKTYNKKSNLKFNLLQRTDRNGVTHIEITRQAEENPTLEDGQPTSIISLNTPESRLFELEVDSKTNQEKKPAIYNSLNLNTGKDSRKNVRDFNFRQQARSLLLDEPFPQSKLKERNDLNLKLSVHKSASIENVLDLDRFPPKENLHQSRSRDKDTALRKVWSSVDDLLDPPKRPERRRRSKGKAPLPPPPVLEIHPEDDRRNVLKGQFVRVNVQKIDNKPVDVVFGRPPLKPNFLIAKPKITTYQEFRYGEPKPILVQIPPRVPEPAWSNSCPRYTRKPRSRSETRNFTPMAYRYIDTAPAQSANSSVTNRLFGMSSKLKDFSTMSTGADKFDSFGSRNDSRRSSLGELSYKVNSAGGSLKSVIKKDDNKKKSNDKKVTFSAYTTVQVV